MEVISVVGLIALALFFFQSLNTTTSIGSDTSIGNLKEIGENILNTLDRQKLDEDSTYDNALEEYIIRGIDDGDAERNAIKEEFRTFIDNSFSPSLPSYNVYVYTYPNDPDHLNPEDSSNKDLLFSSVSLVDALTPGGDQEITRVHRFVIHDSDVYDVEICVWHSI